jgi:hypothetical protein
MKGLLISKNSRKICKKVLKIRKAKFVDLCYKNNNSVKNLIDFKEKTKN